MVRIRHFSLSTASPHGWPTYAKEGATYAISDSDRVAQNLGSERPALFLEVGIAAEESLEDTLAAVSSIRVRFFSRIIFFHELVTRLRRESVDHGFRYKLRSEALGPIETATQETENLIISSLEGYQEVVDTKGLELSEAFQKVNARLRSPASRV